MKIKFDFIKTSFPITSNIIPTFLLFNSINKILIPSYTSITDQFLPHVNHLFTPVNTKRFINDLDFILKHFKPIDLPSLIQLNINKEKTTQKYFHLTIDDGLRECYDLIRPILKAKGIPCTFFLNPSFLDNKDLMYRYKISLIIDDIYKNENKMQAVVQFIKRKLGVRREAAAFLKTLKYSHQRFLTEIAQLTETNFSEYLQTMQPYLSTQQVEKLISEGFSIGAHSMDHPEYYMLSEEEQVRQTIDSIQFVNNNFHTKTKAFSFPFTDKKVSINFFSKLYNPENSMADISFGSSGLKNDPIPFNLQRIIMDKPFSGKEIIKGEYLYYLATALVNKNIIIRK